MAQHRPPAENAVHAQHAKHETEDTKTLHVADQVEAGTDVLDLGDDVPFPIAFLVFSVQGTHEGSQRQETVGIGQHQQCDGRKEQGRGVDGNV